ncbi:uncharacterized protein LOC134278614 [Saccostrea cucullata]|uniref:uncharacterized protein LOC134278614 n=1 Tax=Saccostrea cuccullata TaxID=36930 RepID=UPI002ED26F3A
MPNSAILTTEAGEKVTSEETFSVQGQSTSHEDNLVRPGPSGGEDTTQKSNPRRGRKRKRRQGGKGKKKKTVDQQLSDVYMCGICDQQCDNECVCCDICDTWYHFICLQVDGDDEEFNSDWYCNTCKNN